MNGEEKEAENQNLFRDGKKDIIPQKFWTDYDFIAKDSGTYFVVIKDEQWIAVYNMNDITAFTVG